MLSCLILFGWRLLTRFAMPLYLPLLSHCTKIRVKKFSTTTIPLGISQYEFEDESGVIPCKPIPVLAFLATFYHYSSKKMPYNHHFGLLNKHKPNFTHKGSFNCAYVVKMAQISLEISTQCV